MFFSYLFITRSFCTSPEIAGISYKMSKILVFTSVDSLNTRLLSLQMLIRSCKWKLLPAPSFSSCKLYSLSHKQEHPVDPRTYPRTEAVTFLESLSSLNKAMVHPFSHITEVTTPINIWHVFYDLSSWPYWYFNAEVPGTNAPCLGLLQSRVTFNEIWPYICRPTCDDGT